MIWDSVEWKENLLSTANWLSRVRLTENTRESTYVRVEREILIGAYSVRKLLDTVKVKDSTKRTRMSIDKYENKARVNHLNMHKIAEIYDLTSIHSEERNLRFICDRFIHSYVLVPGSDNDNRLEGFFVTTDHDRNNKLYWVPLRVIVRMFRLVGRDYPTEATWWRDSASGDIQIRVP